nr:CBO0543 family protein [uncultured Bacillus sp.]
MNFIFGFFCLFILWRFGEWKNYKTYYPTILFMIIGDLLYNLFTSQTPTWSYNPDFICRNHTLVNLWVMMTTYPATVLIFLPHYPERRSKQILYIFLWSVLYGLIETIGIYLVGNISHHNGWNMWWSMAFNIVLFTMLPIHHKRPLLAWGLSIMIIISLLNIFNINVLEWN